jgi:hypothetical protein
MALEQPSLRELDRNVRDAAAEEPETTVESRNEVAG